jgi:hypothetical protein
VRVEVVLKDVGARENGAKAHVALKYYFSRPKTKLQSMHL